MDNSFSAREADSGVLIYDLAKIINREKITFGHHILIDDFVFIYARKQIVIGNYVHIALYTSITGGEEVVVGDFCGISQGVRLLTATDDFVDWGFGNSTVPEEYRNTKRGKIEIGKFAIIGANSTILPGVTIGEGCSVGANSVVTRDLEPWGVYIGNKRIRERNKEGVLNNYQKFLDRKNKEEVGS